MYDLAIHPEYVAPLREEIEGFVLTDGWKKQTLMKMWKLDSFIKESLRIHASASYLTFELFSS